MTALRSDLAARLAAATREDTVRGLIFNAAFDVAREHGGDGLAREVDPAGKARRADFLAYPVVDFLRLSYGLAERVGPALGGEDAAFREMGYRATANVLGSMLGSTLLAFGRKARTLLAQSPSAYKATVSYGERFVVWEGPTQARLEFVRDFMNVPFHVGVLRAALDGTDVTSPHVEGRSTGFMQFTFLARWDEAP